MLRIKYNRAVHVYQTGSIELHFVRIIVDNEFDSCLSIGNGKRGRCVDIQKVIVRSSTGNVRKFI